MSTIRVEQLTVGTVITYRLLPMHRPTHPERLWRGRIIRSFPGQQVVWVESLEEGYEGETEYVELEQITGLELER